MFLLISFMLMLICLALRLISFNLSLVIYATKRKQRILREQGKKTEVLAGAGKVSALVAKRAVNLARVVLSWVRRITTFIASCLFVADIVVLTLLVVIGSSTFILFSAIAGSTNMQLSETYSNDSSYSSTYTPGGQSVNEDVQSYDSLIQKYAAESGISEYTNLIKAVMMQESHGQGNNPMQVAVGTVSGPEDSIKQGIKILASMLSKAGVTDPSDMEHIKLALQGYNMGEGYISFAVGKYGKYTKESAVEFSSKMLAENADKHWTVYGDTDYVDHVLQYY